MIYELKPTHSFVKKLKKITKNDSSLKDKLEKTTTVLKTNPFHPSLKSHKAETVDGDRHWSSWVTGDIRIIWDFDKNNNIIILLLDIGKHSGSHKIYK